ncbi:MAG: hypothetical protein RSC68_16375 [Acinetobacter sp.]
MTKLISCTKDSLSVEAVIAQPCTLINGYKLSPATLERLVDNFNYHNPAAVFGTISPNGLDDTKRIGCISKLKLKGDYLVAQLDLQLPDALCHIAPRPYPCLVVTQSPRSTLLGVYWQPMPAHIDHQPVILQGILKQLEDHHDKA